IPAAAARSSMVVSSYPFSTNRLTASCASSPRTARRVRSRTGNGSRRMTTTLSHRSTLDTWCHLRRTIAIEPMSGTDGPSLTRPPKPSRRSNVMPTTKRRALILISSGRQLPLAAPAEVKSISTGFFLVEMAQVLKEFENDYEFTFATPDGNAPQLDINGMGLAVHAIEKTGVKTLPLRMQQRRRSFDVSSFRQRHPELVARREQEVRLLERHIGQIPVSELLPNSEPELAEYRPELIRRLDKLPKGTFHSLRDLVQRTATRPTRSPSPTSTSSTPPAV